MIQKCLFLQELITENDKIIQQWSYKRPSNFCTLDQPMKILDKMHTVALSLLYSHCANLFVQHKGKKSPEFISSDTGVPVKSAHPFIHEMGLPVIPNKDII